ncbi:dihydrodipicolinate synthase family protein [Blastopirellula marina]|uniref:Dihydrodipicolinate synthase family protein n=1 Tax=Blastopirellula marina TaxID=124 RepID=A0A2S8F0A3_9BACT|nr:MULTISPECIES: dihydrodipicolinate synthase family protein [Pirellulaceae]PQO25605.1 dihydrodipicolinate synthase family protein [Blastopirellula marina]RCS43288.1 dihydrodipicolinate synthase family protein [Bremerella cremea]
MSSTPFIPQGVIPACLMPFDALLEVDERSYRRHLRELSCVEGITAITVNGHAAEVHALSFEEQRRSIEIARDEIAGKVPLVAGIHTGDTREAAQLATMAANAGADALLVFPSDVLAMGGRLRPECARAHIEGIAASTELPLILFQYPMSGGLGYSLDTLLELYMTFPSIKAIKDWCNDPHLHEQHIRELHALDRPVRVLSTHSMWLLASLVMGCDGLLSGAGSVIANLQVALFQAVQNNDLQTARQINDRIYPTVKAFYCDPLLDMHNRMKEALVLLDRLDAAHVRPPLVKLTQPDIERIALLLKEARILPSANAPSDN